MLIIELYPVAFGSSTLQALHQTVVEGIVEGITIPVGTKVLWLLGSGRDLTIYPQTDILRPKHLDPNVGLKAAKETTRCLS